MNPQTSGRLNCELFRAQSTQTDENQIGLLDRRSACYPPEIFLCMRYGPCNGLSHIESNAPPAAAQTGEFCFGDGRNPSPTNSGCAPSHSGFDGHGTRPNAAQCLRHLCRNDKQLSARPIQSFNLDQGMHWYLVSYPLHFLDALSTCKIRARSCSDSWPTT